MISGTQVGTPYKHLGREVQVTFYGPDYLSYVDGQQVGTFWVSADAADQAARRHIDALAAEEAKQAQTA